MINGLQGSLNQTLTTYAKGLAQNKKSAVQDFVCSRVSVPTSVGRFKKFSDKNDFQIPDSNLPASGQPNRIEFASKDGTYNCAPQALEGVLTKQDLDAINFAGGDPLNIQQHIVNTVVSSALRRNELDVFNAIASSVTAGTIGTVTPAGKWSTGNTDPVADIDSAIQNILLATGQFPNRMVIDPISWKILKNHPKVVSRTVYGTSFKGLTPQILAGYLMNPDMEIRIASLVKDTAQFNPTDGANKAFILGGGCYIFYGQDGSTTYDAGAFKMFMTDTSNVEAVYTYMFPNQLAQGNIVYWSRDIQVVSAPSAQWLPVS